ncbi:MAG TPA: phosphoadenosine phosphosulfate reductase family protein, partial [Phycisphaerae bacterium]|nr:phosphoadenosine phosphosulfate reductase family protein [Phycisphaerae bacterium]
MGIKRYRDVDVLAAARKRIRIAFDNFERIYVAFSGGKDSSVLLHLVMEEAIARERRVAVMLIDFEAQYAETIKHAAEMFAMYRDNIDPHWI